MKAFANKSSKNSSNTDSGYTSYHPTNYLQRDSLGAILRNTQLQKKGEEEEEALQTKSKENAAIQREAEPEEDIQTKRLQRQDEEELQPKTLQRQEDEELQTKSLQRQDEEELQTKPLQRQEEEEPLQAFPIQKKLSVGQANDKYEQEADSVADQVMRMPSNQIQKQSIAEQDEEAVQTKPLANQITPLVQRQTAQPEEELQTKSDSENTSNVSQDTESKIDQMRGSGNSLSPNIEQEMGDKIGADFSSVNVHSGSDAADLNRQVNARAFTVGNDVFFGGGEYAPESDSGKRLLAHELTHVVQQRSAGNKSIRRAVDPSPTVAAGSEAETKLNELSTLDLPPIKHRHAALYSGHGARRAAGYRRNTTEEQVNVWKQGVNLTEDTIEDKIRQQMQRNDPNAEFTRPSSPYGQVSFTLPGKRDPVSGQWRGIRNQLLIPDWDRRGTYLNERSTKFQVDHMIELQVFGDTTGNAGNVPGNLELLKGSPNASSGSTIKNKIYQKVYAFLGAQDPNFNNLASATRSSRRRAFLSTHTLTFDEMARGEGRDGSDTDWWTRAEIEEGTHLDLITPEPPRRLQGSSGNFVLASGQGGVEIARYNYSTLNIEPTRRSQRKAMAGLDISSIELNSAVEQGDVDSDVGFIHATWDLPSGFRSGEEVSIPLKGIGPYCAGPGEIPGLNTDFSHLSPVSFSTLEIRNGHIYSEGQVDPTIPLFSQVPIGIILDGDELRFQIEYSSGMLNLPIPGVSIEDSTVALFYSTTEGFGGSGDVEFAVNRLGAGNLGVEVSQRSGFSATGQFDFDSDLFDRARVNIWYRDGAFGGSGEIGIDSPDKIKGIRSANITASFSDNEFSATGEVEPDIPGVEQAGLDIEFTEEEGLTIGGNLALNSETPGIESGSVDVTLNKQEDEWKVAATGTAVPSIPGVNSELRINYNDGAFTAEVTANYERGMLSGELTAGVTNRTVDEEGELSETAEPDNPLIVYGGGSLTIQIAPWLQGTAGVQFSPNGEITVTGEIGLPDELEIFARREIDRSIFNVAVQAPIFPGIVAEIGGGLSATAGIGPGVIDELRLGITYNPEREEDTTITGDAHLNIPADAGLRLAVRAGIGLGITGASATGGLEIGGTLGIEGAAEAGVHVEWSPSSGIDLRANLGIHAQPAFTFDIAGYVSVRALGFSVYDQTWELASFRFGSDLRFGINMPIHYQEGQPFDISTDDIEFEVPDIDTDQLLRGLISRIA